ncbi:vacuolar protein sorting-associated protein 13 isoform X3 [Histomonas meleagridis]|uniref:vacuolar protein sorting-associated protein 13 isoform X3 n=1 Tax=Histomonas meleagridis TaxID=135588 RepID=UPI00355A1413|nr:vacuolar protein sorting-associated protein 13 isoform X3 [Histomonas meleagridis]KAH0803020.1 vacuolar protein sorting-associated protein 13 isoform X3 [Histomonas meleagridis]
MKQITSDNNNINDNQTASGAISWGIKSFASGLANAAAGIIKKPIIRGKEEGIIGVMKGTGEGMLGLFTNSLSGALDLSAGMINGVRRGIFGNEKMKRIEEPMKIRGNLDDLLFFEVVNNDKIIEVHEQNIIWNKKIIQIRNVLNVEVDNENKKIILVEVMERKNKIIKIELEFVEEVEARKFCNAIRRQKFVMDFDENLTK